MKRPRKLDRLNDRRRYLVGAVLLFAGFALVGCRDKKEVIMVPENVPPPIPSGVTSLTGDNWVEVYWDPIRGLDDLEGYGVYRSSASEGPYHKLAVVLGAESNFYRDETALNGVKYYYAVDAFDREGLESDLSLEDVFDTPRPARDGLRVYNREYDPAQSGVDLSEQPSHTDMVVGWNDPQTDFFFYKDTDGVTRVVGTVVHDTGGDYPNDIQDLGWTSSLDDVGWAPAEGWVRSPVGLEIVPQHTYVVWTWDDHYAKFRVTAVDPTNVVLDWAYQVDAGNQELAPPVILQAREG
jgi:hypothetical protein